MLHRAYGYAYGLRRGSMYHHAGQFELRACQPDIHFAGMDGL